MNVPKFLQKDLMWSKWTFHVKCLSGSTMVHLLYGESHSPRPENSPNREESKNVNICKTDFIQTDYLKFEEKKKAIVHPFFFTILCTVTCILHCPTMLFHGHTMNNTIWNNTEIGMKPSIKKKKWSQMRSKTKFRGVGEGGLFLEDFPLDPRGKVPFSRFLYFPHVDKYFLLAIFSFLSCWQKFGGFFSFFHISGKFLQIWP